MGGMKMSESDENAKALENPISEANVKAKPSTLKTLGAAAYFWLLLGLTGYSVYTAFGPGSKELRDPFDDHED